MRINLMKPIGCLVLCGAIAVPALAQQDQRDSQNRNSRDGAQQSQRDYSDDQSRYQSRQDDRDWQQDEREWRDQRDRQDDQQRMRDRREQRRQQRDDRRDERQWRDDRQRDDQRRQDRQRQDRQRQRQQGDRQAQRDRGQQDQQRFRIQPEGWVAVAYDYDNDGYYEHADYIYIYDLQDAQQRSQQRARDEQRRRQARSQDQQRGQQVRVQGVITNLGIKNMTLGDDRSSDRDHRFARLETDTGRSVRVCLGSEEKVSQLNLSEGDHVRIEGVRARVDDKRVILASRVSAGGDSITNDLPRREHWQRVSGEIRDVYTARGDDRDERHTVVEVRTDDDRTRQIDLGPERELQDLDLQDGDQITVLARQGRIGGQSMLIAQKVRANDETIDVREATNRSLRRDGNRDRRQQR